MPQHDLEKTLKDLARNLNITEELYTNAPYWTLLRPPPGVVRFSKRHKEMVIELAFLRAYLAWEMFLEEAFILYLIGKRPPKGRPPHRYVSPPSRKVAEQLILPEDWQYVKWTVASKVAKRAERFFRQGRPFTPILQPQVNAFDEMRILRNAIAHWQHSTQEKFKSIVRRHSSTGTYPPKLTVGGFLEMNIPSSSPPETYFSNYLNRLRLTAQKIIPT